MRRRGTYGRPSLTDLLRKQRAAEQAADVRNYTATRRAREGLWTPRSWRRRRV